MKRSHRTATRFWATFTSPDRRRSLSRGAVVCAALLAAALPARAEDVKAAPAARIIVIGEGSVSVPPDYARLTSGVTTRAKTAKDASDANAKAMAGLLTALQSAGIEQKDIQTSHFFVQPIYTSPGPNMEQKLTGFSVSNQVNVTIRQISKVGDVLDQMVTAGATDAGNVEFLHADLSKTLDRAREAAMADARRKAELYARAAGLALGSVAFITEESSSPLFAPKMALRAAMPAAAPPIASGEDTLQVRITVGYEIGH
jgi:uncharacterized protein YggE